MFSDSMLGAETNFSAKAFEGITRAKHLSELRFAMKFGNSLFEPIAVKAPQRLNCRQAYHDYSDIELANKRRMNLIVGEKGMILRLWKARSTAERAGDYIQHAKTEVFPKVRAIQGHRGQYLLRRPAGDGVELVVITLWDSMEAVHTFAGTEPDQAVVDPEARSLLADFDEFVTHYEVVDGDTKSEKF